MIKQSLSLVNDKPNIFSFPQSTIDSFSVDDSDKELYLSSVKIFMPRMKSHFTYPYVKFHVDTNFKYLDIIRLSKYPLPAVFNKTTKHGIINITALQKRSISNIDMRDLYTILAYAHVCLVMSLGTDIPKNYSHFICEYMGFVFLKLFAKKYGITGDYIDKIPQFRFMVYLYTYMSFFGYNKAKAIKEAAHLSKYNPAQLDVPLKNYDLTDFDQFLKLLSDSDVTPGLNKYRFLDQIIRSFGTMNLPFFEDLMRFSCVMVGSSISGNSYFSAAFQMFNPNLFSKAIKVIGTTVNKAM
jgi:hypothetical protein